MQVSLKRLYKYLPRQWDTHGYAVKLSNKTAQTTVEQMSKPLSGEKDFLDTSQKWSDSSLANVKTAFHHKSSQCSERWKSVSPPQDGSTHVPQAQWSLAPGSCAAPAKANKSSRWVVQVHTRLPLSVIFNLMFWCFYSQEKAENYVSMHIQNPALTERNVVPQPRCLRSQRAPGQWLQDHGSHWTHRTPAAKKKTQRWSLVHKRNSFFLLF